MRQVITRHAVTPGWSAIRKLRIRFVVGDTVWSAAELQEV